MARKTVKIPISTSDPAALVELARKIAERQASASSSKAIAAEIDVVAFMTMASKASTLQAEIDTLARALDEKTELRDRALGIAEGQNSQSEGTLLFEILRIRDLLLGASRGNEKALEPWGFNVSVGEAKSPTKKKAATTGTT